jgi:hypothetical protein
VRDLRGSGRLRKAVVGLVVGTALLSGCSEKQEANETLPSTSAPRTTEALPEIGPADFPVPDKARTKDAAGAEAFLRYWVDLINRQRAIPAGQPLRDLGPECNDCWRIANNYDEVQAAGQHYDGGELTLNDVTEPQMSGEESSINFGIRQEAVVLVDAADKPVDSGMPMQPNLGSGITLTWSDEDESWLVVSMTLG